MNEITIGNEDYEVLSLDPESIQHVTHARLAGGKVVDAKFDECTSKELEFISFKIDDLQEDIFVQNLNPLGIQPLKLLEKVPVEFTGRITQSWVSVERADFVTVTLTIPFDHFKKFPLSAVDGKKVRVIEVVD